MQVRPVKLGALFGGLRSVVSGITTADRVVVNGQMHARPGSAVAPTEVTIKADEGTFSDPGMNVASERKEDGHNVAETKIGTVPGVKPAAGKGTESSAIPAAISTASQSNAAGSHK